MPDGSEWPYNYAFIHFLWVRAFARLGEAICNTYLAAAEAQGGDCASAAEAQARHRWLALSWLNDDYPDDGDPPIRDEPPDRCDPPDEAQPPASGDPPAAGPPAVEAQPPDHRDGPIEDRNPVHNSLPADGALPAAGALAGQAVDECAICLEEIGRG
eukprot:EG_transcript_38362